MSAPTEIDRRHLARAIELAEGGRGRVSPNPLVGAVIGRHDEVLGEGFHQALGGPHAEVEAIRAAEGRDLGGATLYVSLEPCCHQGKTPPCTDAIREAGISAARRRLRRSERARLRVAGSGSCATRGSRSWSPTASWRSGPGCSTSRFASMPAPAGPWVLFKSAMTLDGKVATRERRLEVDLGRGEPPARAPVAVPVRCRRGRDRHRARRRSAADRRVSDRAWSASRAGSCSTRSHACR